MQTGEGHAEAILLSRIALLERRMQSLADIVCADDDGQADLPDALIVEPDSQTELAQGFHLREWDAAGRPFRWAGRADYFEFRFLMDRTLARGFRMRGMFAPSVPPETLTAFVDYRAIPLRVERDGGMVEIAGRIPADRLGAAVTLTFFCPARPSPQAEDTRRLSFAFSRLHVGEPRASVSRDAGAGDRRAETLGANSPAANPARTDSARADVTRADVTRADVTRADLARADLARADLAHADLVHAELPDPVLVADVHREVRGGVAGHVSLDDPAARPRRVA